MIGGMRWRWAGALALAVVAGTNVAGFPQAATDPPVPSATAQSLLGELSTIDPCSLTSPPVFSSFGTATFDTPNTLDDCIVDIETPDGARGFVRVGDLDHAQAHPNFADKEVRSLSGGLYVVDYRPATNYCNQLLVFPDAITLSVTFWGYDGDPPPPCDVASAATDKVVDVIRAGTVKHRTFPPGSLGTVDPCGITPPDAPAVVPELRAVKPASRPGRHGCVWSTADAKARIRVEFRVATRGQLRGHVTRDTIAGRVSATDLESKTADGAAFCGVETVHMPFTADGQEDLFEVAGVSAEVPAAELPTACQVATEVATAVWPNLPQPVT